jgi:hypothetical protein
MFTTRNIRRSYTNLANVSPLNALIVPLMRQVAALATPGFGAGWAEYEIMKRVVPNPIMAMMKWNQTAHYSHTKQDLINIRDGSGYIYVYRGSPEEHAEDALENGLWPYQIEDVARKVAFTYGISLATFKKFAPRAQTRQIIPISSAPALIAFRWASNFKYGEVMSDFNSHARMIVAAFHKTHRQRITLSDAYEQLHNEAISWARVKGLTYTTDAAPDILGLPDKFPRRKATGAITQIKIRADLLTEHFGHDAGVTVEAIEHPELHKYNQYPLLSWNDAYRDFRLQPADIISMKIVVRGIPFHSSDIVREMLKTHYVNMNTGRILGKRSKKDMENKNEF